MDLKWLCLTYFNTAAFFPQVLFHTSLQSKALFTIVLEYITTQLSVIYFLFFLTLPGFANIVLFHFLKTIYSVGRSLFQWCFCSFLQIIYCLPLCQTTFLALFCLIESGGSKPPAIKCGKLHVWSCQKVTKRKPSTVKVLLVFRLDLLYIAYKNKSGRQLLSHVHRVFFSFSTNKTAKP